MIFMTYLDERNGKFWFMDIYRKIHSVIKRIGVPLTRLSPPHFLYLSLAST